MTTTTDWEAAGRCCVKGMAIQDNTVYGVGKYDGKVLTQSLNAMTRESSWTQASLEGEVTGIAIHNNYIYGTGTDGKIYKQALSGMSKTSPWEMTGRDNCLDVAIHGETDTIYCVGTDYGLHKQTLSTMTTGTSWSSAGQCCVKGITIKGNTIYGVGKDNNQVYMQSMQSVTAMPTSPSWEDPATKGDVIDVEVIL